MIGLLLITFLSFLSSMLGLMTLLAGFVTFFLLPLISKASRFKIFSRFFLRLATFPMHRASFVVSESNEIYFKQLNLELGLMGTELDGVMKMVEDPAQRMHHWMGMRFGLVDEEHGVVFDPRDAATGMSKQEYDDKGEGEFLATDDEWKQFGIAKWKPAVFELPGTHQIVNLSAVQALIDGGERSEFPVRVEELFKNSQDPFSEGTSLAKFIYPILGFVIPFFGIWLGVDQLGGPTSTVSFGSLGILAGLKGKGPKELAKQLWDWWRDATLRVYHWLRQVDWKGVIGVILIIGMPLGVEYAIVRFAGPIMAIVATIVFLLGFSIMPLLTLTGKASSWIGGGLSKLYFRMGLMGYRRPVLEWTPAKYRLREYDQLETANQTAVTWYEAFGSLLGFTFDPSPDSWGAEYVNPDTLESYQPATDGGKTSMKTNIPAKYVRVDQLSRDDYGGFIPKRIKKSKQYIKSGIAMNRFANTAIGEKSLRKLLEAKDEHGGGDSGVDDSTVLKTTVITTIFGAISGIGVFLLLPML